MKEAPSNSGSLITLRLLCGLPLLASPVLLIGGIFALTAYGASLFQQAYTVAVMAYPVVYIAGFSSSSQRAKAGDSEGAVRAMILVLYYLLGILALWPIWGPK